MSRDDHRRLIEKVEKVVLGVGVLDQVAVFDLNAGETYLIEEGKWIPTRSANKIRIDHPTHGVGQTHAHVYGRKGNQIGVVNLDGTASHGTRMRLSEPDAVVLQARGFKIPDNRIVEWRALADDTLWALFG